MVMAGPPRVANPPSEARPSSEASQPGRFSVAGQPGRSSLAAMSGRSGLTARSGRWAAAGAAFGSGKLPSFGAWRPRHARRPLTGWLLPAVALLLTACDPVQPRVAAPQPGGPGESAPLAADAAATANARPAAVDGASLAAADLERGEVLSLACQACHPLDAGADAIIGPNLNGVFGRRAAAVPDFAYSDALRQADLVWTPEVLDRWLANPADFLPGNNMAFAGYRSPVDRRDLIAFLLEATRPPQGPE